MNELIAKPLAIVTCGVFNMKRRAKEALPAQGSIEWVVIVVCIAVALDRRPGVPVRRDEQQDQHRREHAQEHYRQRRPCRQLGTSDRFPSRRHHNSYI